ncbi:response regulator [Halomonas mongoliensis]|uniref:response regulator n=1 Tax=Halomonas mongoliensis TaxID=321265 RepID=UPI00403ACC61
MWNPADHDTQLGVILCAEDQDSLRTDICDELREAGYGVLEATNGDETLRQIHAATPDLILCDINMPGPNGYEVLAEIRRQRPDLADTPFVFLTALSDAREVVEGKRLGADDYLVKPVDFDLLLATVEARLRQVRRMRDKAAREVSELRQAMARLHQKASDRALEGVTRALDLVAPGMLLLTHCGEVLFANRAARALADESNGLRLGETLSATRPGQAQRLRRALNAVMDANNRSDEVECLRLPRQGERRDLLIIACSLNPPPQEPAAVVLISDPEQRSHIPQQVLARLFGLTPTEARIALALAEGRRSEEVAAQMSISPTTVAFHLRNLFQKTDTRRQSELIAVILTGAMAVALEEKAVHQK